MSEMGRCRDCRFWKPWPERQTAVCELLSEELLDSDAPKPKATIIDDTAYRPYLSTSPDFGCVQFEAKMYRRCQFGDEGTISAPHTVHQYGCPWQVMGLEGPFYEDATL